MVAGLVVAFMAAGLPGSMEVNFMGASFMAAAGCLAMGSDTRTLNTSQNTARSIPTVTILQPVVTILIPVDASGLAVLEAFRPRYSQLRVAASSTRPVHRY
jgi:hypothetical protein